MAVAASGLVLKNINDGSDLTTTIAIVGAPGTGSTAGVPDPGTPLANTFDGYVYFGSGSTPNSAIQLSSGSSQTITFSGLDPAKRYKFRGGAIRGNPTDTQNSTANYINRWTKADIQGIDGATPAHQQGAGSRWGYLDATRAPGSLTGFEAAYNTGVNTNGDMMAWDDINPGSDGSFSVYCVTYTGAVPAGFGTELVAGSSGGSYGYGFNGFRLEEYTPGGDLTVTVTPTSQTVVQCGTAIFNANASGGLQPYSYEWHKTGYVPGGAISTSNRLVLNNVQTTDAGDYFVLVTDANSTVVWSGDTTGPATLAVTPDSGTPSLVSAVGAGDPNTIIVTFSKKVTLSSSTGGDFSVAPAPGYLGSPLTLTSSVVTNGTNVVLTSSTPRDGVNYLVSIVGSGVTDACLGTVVSGSANLLEALMLLPWSGSWKYDQSNTEFPTTWKNVGDTTSDSWTVGGGAFDGLSSGPRNIVGTVAVGTQLSGVFGSAGGDVPTYYFRTTVNFPANVNPAQATVLIRTLLDDGAIVYVNGNEVYRTANVEPADEPHANYLGATVGTAGISAYLPINPTNFVDGNNVVCVYLKQGNATSTDITMGLEISTIVTNFLAVGGPINIAITPAGPVNLNQCDNLSLVATVSGGYRPYSYQWLKDSSPLSNGGNISGVDTANLIVGNVGTGDAGSYQLRVTDNQSTVQTSSGVQVNVAATAAPAMVAAVGAVDLHTITVSFDRPVAISSPAGADFLVRQIGGVAQLGITNAVVTNATNVVLRTADPRQAEVNYEVVVQGSGVTSVCGSIPVNDGTTRQVACQVLLFGLDINNQWKYNQEGTDLGTTWKDLGYNDTVAGWVEGPALLDGKSPQPPGRTALNGQTVRSQLNLTNSVFPLNTLRIPTYYFRKQFSLPANWSGVSLSCRTFFDDGGIVYVNGQRAHSMRITSTNEAFGAYLEGSTNNVGDANFEGPFPLATPVLNTGDNNVVAVYLKQLGGDSSDITMGLELIATVSNFGSLGPRLSITRDPGTGCPAISWLPAEGTLQECTNFSDWGPSAIANGGVDCRPGPRFYRIHP